MTVNHFYVYLIVVVFSTEYPGSTSSDADLVKGPDWMAPSLMSSGSCSGRLLWSVCRLCLKT